VKQVSLWKVPELFFDILTSLLSEKYLLLRRNEGNILIIMTPSLPVSEKL
jgi:hypothetical protein